MFSLGDLRFVLCSRDLDMLSEQRIMGLFILITHKSTRPDNPIQTYCFRIKSFPLSYLNYVNCVSVCVCVCVCV